MTGQPMTEETGQRIVGRLTLLLGLVGAVVLLAAPWSALLVAGAVALGAAIVGMFAGIAYLADIVTPPE